MIRAAALLLLLGAAPAPRTLDAQSLGPVRVGMTVAAASRALGAPLRVDYVFDDDHHCGDARRRDGRDAKISYMVEGGRISRIDVDTPAIRAAKGVGVGSTPAQIRRAYGAAVHSRPHAYTDGEYLEVRAPGGQFALLFEVEGRKVTTMRGGRYPSVRYIEGCA